MTNVNPATGIRFGYIAANSLDPEVVHELMYGAQAKDIGYEAAWLDFLAMGEQFRQRRIESGEPCPEIDPEEHREAFNDNWQIDEPSIEGEYEGVKYRSSWLGGALNFFILESLHIAECAVCSPCVPGAADLDNQYSGGVVGYDVPADWRYKE